ncbi:unnamed protein product [Orchesella dallaii]|uniref:Uncharacterized protein n=1 Tax=Orchesella dallaii TaxID=48710 RepID=A0ABP1QVC5_9HEXA
MSRIFLIKEYLEQQLDVPIEKARMYAMTLSKILDSKPDVAIFVLEKLIGVSQDLSSDVMTTLLILTECHPLQSSSETSKVQVTESADVKVSKKQDDSGQVKSSDRGGETSSQTRRETKKKEENEVMDAVSNKDERNGSVEDVVEEFPYSVRENIAAEKGAIVDDSLNASESGSSGGKDENVDGESGPPEMELMCPFCLSIIIGLEKRIPHLLICKMLPDTEIRTRELEANFQLMIVRCPTHKKMTWIPPFIPTRKCVLCPKFIIWDIDCFTRHLETDHSPFPKIYILPELHEMLSTIISNIDYLETMEENLGDETLTTVSRIEEKYRSVMESDFDRKILTRAKKRESRAIESLPDKSKS